MSREGIPWVDPTVGSTLLTRPTLGQWPPGTVDIVLEVPKSVSIFWAALLSEHRNDDAEQVISAHEAGVHAALEYLNREAAWARLDGAYVASAGLRAIQLEHIEASDEPKRPPHIHTHLFTELYVTALEDGQTHELDRQSLERELWAAMSFHDVVLRNEMVRALPVSFERPPEGGVREMTGISEKLIRFFAGSRCWPYCTMRQLIASL